MDFEIDDEQIDDRTHLIELTGEIDLYTAPAFKERLGQAIDQGRTRLVVDLSGATFIDSTTLGILVGGVKRLDGGGGALAIVCTAQSILKVFRVTGLDRVFSIVETRDEALSEVAAGDAA